MSLPDFERPDPNYEFTKGEEIYVTDKNKFDIWKATIKKISPNGFAVHYEYTGEDKKYPNTKRFLLRTERNNEIFNQQEESRSKSQDSKDEDEPDVKKKQNDKEGGKKNKTKINKTKASLKSKPKAKPAPKPKKKKSKDENVDEFVDDEEDEEIFNGGDDESEDSQTDDEDPSNEYDNGSQSGSDQETKHRRKKSSHSTNKPIIDYVAIVHNAWQSGIHDTDTFRSFMTENVNKAIENFEKLYKVNNASEYPLFKIGKVDDQEVKKFWIQCQASWNQLFGEFESVPTKDFLKKASSFFKLPYQKEANARDTLKFFFDPEANINTDFFQFCSFISMFGPRDTVMRKLSQFFKCPPEMKNMLNYSDITDLPPDKCEDTEMNCFTLRPDGKEEEEGKENGPEANDENAEQTTNEKEIAVYNIPHISTDGNYLVDSFGNEYKDWLDFFEKNNPKAENNE